MSAYELSIYARGASCLVKWESNVLCLLHISAAPLAGVVMQVS